MNKCHSNINWVNDTVPAINDTNLNYMDGCIDTLDDRVISLDTTKALQSDLLLAFKDVSLDPNTGVITFTLFNNTVKTIDTLLEKIAINFDYDDDPTSAHYESLIITLQDGTVKYIDMSALITQYEFVNSSTVSFTVGSDGKVTANVIDGSITNAKLNAEVMSTIQGYNNSAAASALKSEGYAVGKQNGTAVESGSPYYENNSEYYSGLSDEQRKESEAWAVGTKDGTAVPSTDAQYENNAKHYAEEASDLVASLLEAFGVNVVGTKLVFGADFENSFNIAVVGTQLQISEIT